VKTFAVDITFHPRWWNEKVGVDFDRKFFWDPDYRVKADQEMRKELYNHFGELGLGEKDPGPRPILGSDLIASGFLYSEILGCEVRYTPKDPPEVIAKNISDEELAAFSLPDLNNNTLWKDTIKQARYLEQEYGSVVSHINLQGVQNIALDLRGSELFIDYYLRPEAAERLLKNCTQLMIEIGKVLRKYSPFVSHGVTAITKKVAPDAYVTSNCTVDMISRETYESHLLSFDMQLAQAFRPFGVHHCGKSMERMAKSYAKLMPEFAEVGAFSNISAVREAMSGVFLNLRYSPVKLRKANKKELAEDLVSMFQANGPSTNVSISCVGIDNETSDEIIKEFLALGQTGGLKF